MSPGAAPSQPDRFSPSHAVCGVDAFYFFGPIRTGFLPQKPGSRFVGLAHVVFVAL